MRASGGRGTAEAPSSGHPEGSLSGAGHPAHWVGHQVRFWEWVKGGEDIKDAIGWPVPRAHWALGLVWASDLSVDVTSSKRLACESMHVI